MTASKMLTCDGCGTTRNLSTEGLGGAVWIQVQSMVATQEEMLAVQDRIMRGQEPKDFLDMGEFCSLRCLANWASAREQLKAVSAAVERDESLATAVMPVGEDALAQAKARLKGLLFGGPVETKDEDGA